jgi:precorrin-2 dehydrogenase/sirohydrochlorin ferrochelatase
LSLKYPVVLSLLDRNILVVGGGKVATRKVKGLLGSGARIKVVSPLPSSEILNLAKTNKLELFERKFIDTDLKDVFLIFAATDENSVNRHIAKVGKSQGALVNVVDDPKACDFYLPARVSKGSVEVSVSTSGTSPALSAWLRDEIASNLPEGLEELSSLTASLRTIFGASIEVSRWKDFFLSDVLDFLARGDTQGVAKIVDEFFGEGTWSKLRNGD